MEIRDARSWPSLAQEDIRMKVLKALQEGKTQVEAAELFGITRQAVGRWVKRYREGGEKALRAKKKGRPRRKSLEPWQAAQIAKAIVDHHPEQLKMPFYLWTRDAVAKFIEKRFGIGLSRWTVGRYLSRCGFTPQKPIRKAFEQDPEKVRYWLDTKYPEIQKEAIQQKAEIFWGDEMGLRSGHAAGRSYGRKGQTPVIPGTGQRFKWNMVSVITNRGKLYFMIFKEGFSAKTFIEFLNRLVRQISHPIFLILDRHPVHRSSQIQKWLKIKEKRIRFFWLPPYSPELNPDENLNQDIKSNVLGRRRPHTQEELVENVRSYLYSRQRKPQIVKNISMGKRFVMPLLNCNLFYAPRNIYPLLVTHHQNLASHRGLSLSRDNLPRGAAEKYDRSESARVKRNN